MRYGLRVWLVVVSLVLCGSLAMGQLFVAPGPEGTLSVTVTGSADGPADWVEISLSIDGKGATYQEALGVCQEASKAVVDELAALGIPTEDVRLGPPEIGGDMYSQMVMAVPGMEEQAAAARLAVRRSVTVRLAAIDPQTLDEKICQVLDAAADAGATIKAPGPVQQVYSQGGAVVFGVNDPKPLRDKAIANGLAAAKEVAEATAASTGGKLGSIAGVQVSEMEAGYMAMVAAVGLSPKPGLATRNVSLTVTYRIQ
ncbi:MAG: DUF541 domain-containing protein [Armatimonadetes bacterium]|nr:DUF541 domain-containing protein [Armatimonadota bacterium]